MKQNDFWAYWRTGKYTSFIAAGYRDYIPELFKVKEYNGVSIAVLEKKNPKRNI